MREWLPQSLQGLHETGFFCLALMQGEAEPVKLRDGEELRCPCGSKSEGQRATLVDPTIMIVRCGHHRKESDQMRRGSDCRQPLRRADVGHAIHTYLAA